MGIEKIGTICVQFRTTWGRRGSVGFVSLRFGFNSVRLGSGRLDFGCLSVAWALSLRMHHCQNQHVFYSLKRFWNCFETALKRLAYLV